MNISSPDRITGIYIVQEIKLLFSNNLRKLQSQTAWWSAFFLCDCVYLHCCTQQHGVCESHGHSSPDVRLAEFTSAHGQLSSLSATERQRLTSRRPVSRSISETITAVTRPHQTFPSTGAHYFNLDRWNGSIGEFDEFSW